MRLSRVPGALVIATLGCSFGATVERFAPATRPQGVAAALTLQGGAECNGELLAVQDTALVVLARDTVTLVSYGAIFRGRFSELGPLLATPPAADFATRLRLLSRFPQGLTPDLLARLLAAQGQSAVKVVAR